MRIILTFGGFRQQIKIADDKAYQPLVIPHPLDRIDIKDDVLPDIKPLKWMTFEYHSQLDHDLLEYEFAREG